jgi:hypothetical protein
MVLKFILIEIQNACQSQKPRTGLGLKALFFYVLLVLED